MKAVLLLEDGTLFEGTGFGAQGETLGEVVFNTSMSGYQEILTDPSYCEQIVTMTYPLIGNYGVNPDDTESAKIQSAGFIVKEACPYPSSWRSKTSLDEYLAKAGITGISGIDTRMLVRHIRTKGAMNGILSSVDTDPASLKAKLKKYPGLVGRDLVEKVTVKKPYAFTKGLYNPYTGKTERPKTTFKVVAFDFGIKTNILRLLCHHGCHVTVVPANTPAEKIMKLKPHGVFLSNGPGDPEGVTYAIGAIRDLLGKAPIFGICLGHHGANHPVKNLKTGNIEITSQNHGFCVDIDSLKGKKVEVTHMNLNDNTVEGFRCAKLPAFCVQYHPEASPGPHDSAYLFQDFIKLMEGFWKKKKKR